MKKFSQFLAEYRAGSLDDLLAAQLQQLVQSVETHLQSGKMTITITLAPKQNGELRAAIQYALKEPKRDTVESILFTTPGGDLLPYNPLQGDMFNRSNVKVIDGETGEVKTKVFGE